MTRSIAPMIVILGVLVAGAARAQSGGAYSLQWGTIDGGGQTPTTGGAYQLSGTTGQPDAGPLVGGIYALNGGFWGPATNGAVDAPETEAVPRAFAARPAVPNPFRSTTTVAFDLPATRAVGIVLYGIDGRVVRRLLNQELPAGRHRAVWDGLDDRGQRVASGIYFARIHAGEFAGNVRLVHLD